MVVMVSEPSTDTPPEKIICPHCARLSGIVPILTRETVYYYCEECQGRWFDLDRVLYPELWDAYVATVPKRCLFKDCKIGCWEHWEKPNKNKVWEGYPDFRPRVPK